MASEKLCVQLACRVLGIAESGYYEWRSRPPSARSLHQASFGNYGSRRVRAELRLGVGDRGRSGRGGDADAPRGAGRLARA
jgi:putative transposase